MNNYSVVNWASMARPCAGMAWVWPCSLLINCLQFGAHYCDVARHVLLIILFYCAAIFIITVQLVRQDSSDLNVFIILLVGRRFYFFPYSYFFNIQLK